MCENLKVKDNRCGYKILVLKPVSDPDDPEEIMLHKGDTTYLKNMQDSVEELGLWEAFINEQDVVLVDRTDFKVIKE